MIDLEIRPERALAIAVNRKGGNREKALEYLNELAFLAETAGATVVELIYQELEKANRATVVGKGKLEELKDIIASESIQLVLFDDDLTPAQHRNIEAALQVKILDRSGVILDIFAKRAQTLEAKTQVELAQLQYLLPKLTRLWTHLSKQYGGLGTKGPGETQIETDRRIVRQRIEKLKNKLSEIETQIEVKRKARKGKPSFALVGYTNAGKSTMMKAITSAEVYIKDELFATLDTTVRGFNLPLGQEALLSDTVGFIRKLPPHLIASFKSTLAEAKESDFIIHVVDVSHQYFRDHIAVVERTLESLHIKDKPIILAMNKIDLLDDMLEINAIKEEYPNAIFLSAGRGIHLNNLLEEMQNAYDLFSNEYELLIPYEESKQLAMLYKLSEILEQKDFDTGSLFKVRVIKDNLAHFQNLFQKFFKNQ